MVEFVSRMEEKIKKLSNKERLLTIILLFSSSVLIFVALFADIAVLTGNAYGVLFFTVEILGRRVNFTWALPTELIGVAILGFAFAKLISVRFGVGLVMVFYAVIFLEIVVQVIW
ncbi:MAG: hypothetical protein ACTSSJ_07760 [Candidatus Odinarchaeia archaeon]